MARSLEELAQIAMGDKVVAGIRVTKGYEHPLKVADGEDAQHPLVVGQGTVKLECPECEADSYIIVNGQQVMCSTCGWAGTVDQLPAAIASKEIRSAEEHEKLFGSPRGQSFSKADVDEMSHALLGAGHIPKKLLVHEKTLENLKSMDLGALMNNMIARGAETSSDEEFSNAFSKVVQEATDALTEDEASKVRSEAMATFAPFCLRCGNNEAGRYDGIGREYRCSCGYGSPLEAIKYEYQRRLGLADQHLGAGETLRRIGEAAGRYFKDKMQEQSFARKVLPVMQIGKAGAVAFHAGRQLGKTEFTTNRVRVLGEELERETTPEVVTDKKLSLAELAALA